MSDSKNFLARWSSRKLASRTASALDEAHSQQPRDETDVVENGAIAENAKDAETPVNRSFDPAQLPPLDSIGRDTDVTAFLHRDVPPELTRAALRRAWTSDPGSKISSGQWRTDGTSMTPRPWLALGRSAPKKSRVSPAT